MTEEKKKLHPLEIKSLADLKRSIKVGTEFTATSHRNHPDIVGLRRVVAEVQSNAFYSKIKYQPEHKYSTCNYGKGFRTNFEKASCYRFCGSTVQVLDVRRSDGSVLYEMEIYGNNIKETEENSMNEWERTHRQTERFKEEYPPGTRILLLHMGDDPRPVEDNMRGTVRFVDDMGTIHCGFDNGRSLGIVPGEDSFRKLTDAELKEELDNGEEELDEQMMGI